MSQKACYLILVKSERQIVDGRLLLLVQEETCVEFLFKSKKNLIYLFVFFFEFYKSEKMYLEIFRKINCNSMSLKFSEFFWIEVLLSGSKDRI